MPHLVRSALALGLVFGPLSAFAQVAQPASDLPVQARAPIGGVVPGLGPTPGVILQVETPASRCATNAARAADGLVATSDAIAVCNDAITSGISAAPDVVATFVNRGVLLMTLQRPIDAKGDFNRALEVQPDAAEALVNRGAILLAEGKPQDALADLDRGIALGPERPERAHFQRALARETLGDLKGAYADYKAAEALKPGWEPVTAELSRFRVVSR